MIDLSIEINKRIKEINALLVQSATRIRKYSNYEDIHVQSNLSRGRNQFYYIDKKSHKKEFIRVKDIKSFSKYIQRDYDIAVNKKLLQRSPTSPPLSNPMKPLYPDGTKKTREPRIHFQ